MGEVKARACGSRARRWRKNEDIVNRSVENAEKRTPNGRISLLFLLFLLNPTLLVRLRFSLLPVGKTKQLLTAFTNALPLFSDSYPHPLPDRPPNPRPAPTPPPPANPS